MSRTFDIVLFGATGFTGGLVADYLARATLREPLRWALAGRSQERLLAVREQLAQVSGATPPALLVADVEDATALAEMAAATTVVISTVGPYARLGEPLVKACAEEGTHYVDLTGEPHFVWRMRSRWDETARFHGARIVNSCGFECIPPDIGALYTVNLLRQRLGEAGWHGARVRVQGGVEAGGGLSGGTWHSAVGAMSEPLKVLQSGPWGSLGDLLGGLVPPLRREPRWQRWALAVPTIDPEVVRQSARLRGRDYGEQFSYNHYFLSRRLWPLAAGVAAVGGLFTLAQFRPTRQWLLRQKPPGDGPGSEARAKGWFRLHFIAEAEGIEVRTVVSGGDPGYGDTAKMLAEAALCLALDRGLPKVAGVITPAVAMGEALIPRLERAGIHFSEERADADH